MSGYKKWIYGTLAASSLAVTVGVTQCGLGADKPNNTEQVQKTGEIGAMKYLLNQKGEKISPGYHRLGRLKDGALYGEIGAMKYLLNQKGEKISPGYHSIEVPSYTGEVGATEGNIPRRYLGKKWGRIAEEMRELEGIMSLRNEEEYQSANKKIESLKELVSESELPNDPIISRLDSIESQIEVEQLEDMIRFPDKYPVQ